MMIMNKVFIEGRIYDVIDYLDYGVYEYVNNGNTAGLALVVGDYVLPVRPRIGKDPEPGVYLNGITYQVVYPRNEEEAAKYSKSHLACLVEAKSIAELASEQSKLTEDEINFLNNTNSENIFAPSINEEDSPLLVALKTAVSAKKCDINAYAYRFGANFNNDRRNFDPKPKGDEKKPSITIDKFSLCAKNTDIRATIILEDMTPNVIKPMKSKVVVTLVGDGVNDEKYEKFYNRVIKDSIEEEE